MSDIAATLHNGVAHIMTELDDAKYTALTTFKRDGSAVMTPVWVVPCETGYRVVTGKSTRKYKRIGNNPAVTIAACNARGATRPGATLYRGTARILNDEESRAAALAVRERYGLMAGSSRSSITSGQGSRGDPSVLPWA